MKKLFILTLLMIASALNAQIDTATWSITKNKVDGRYSLLTNRVTIGGVAAGGIVIPLILTANEIDTSKFQLLPNSSNGKYSIATNKGVLYGIDTNDIRVSVSYDMGGINLGNANTWTGTQTFDSIIVSYATITKTNFVNTDTTFLNIIPAADSTYDIGNSTNAFRDAYIDGYVYLAGNATIDGSWRFYGMLNGDLIFETRVSGTWTEKSRITK